MGWDGITSHCVVDYFEVKSLPDFQVERIEPEIRIGRFQFSFPKLAHYLIKLLADPRDSAFVDASQAQSFDRFIDQTGTHALDRGFLDHYEQCLFAVGVRAGSGNSSPRAVWET